MKAAFLSFLLGVLLCPSLWAIPNSFLGNGNAIPIIPSFPRFNADLTEEFLDLDKWKAGDFSGPWAEEPSLPDLEVRRMTANPVVMGEVPMTVVAYGNGHETTEIAIHFLDAGVYFGYRYGGEQSREARHEGRSRRTEFSRHFKSLSESVRERLEEGCGRGEAGVIGKSPSLRTEFTEYQWESFRLRLVEREDHSVSLHIYKMGQAPASLVESEWLGLGRREQQARLQKGVSESAGGIPEVKGLPMFTQGMTPFCGIHSLAMVGHYIGLRTSPEALAAAAEFKNTGSAGGSDMIGLHRAVAEELGMRVSISPKFDADRVERSIQQGLPVIVWRRVSAEREKHHSKVVAQSREDGAASLPMLTPKELDSLPERDTKGSPSHSSIVTGVNLSGKEVLYIEPWGEAGKGRRMRLEEMEATAYAVFYFKL